MSWLSSAVGKIPIVGHALNQVGKVLPSVGQIAGGALLGPVGATIGGAIDPHTTGLQKGIGYGVDAAAAGLGGLGALTGGGIGLGSLGGLGKIPGGLGTLAGAAGKLLGGGSGGGGINLGSLADAGLGTAGLINASNLQNKSNDYATNAYNQAQDAYTSRAPLRTAGVAGMLNPSSGVDLSALRGAAGAGNPFAKKPPIALGSIGQPTGQA